MSNLTLDGSTSFIGTEFIKLLATGSSNLATEEYVDDAIEQGGGGGNVDLTNYYNKSETDGLLNNKLNVNNPQDIIGNLRIDSTNGNGKIIINAVAPATATDDFYCNGTGHFNGSLRVSVLTSDGDVNADGCNADTFNSHIITNDIVFKHNDVEYQRYNATDDEIQLSKNIDVGSSTLICNSFDSGLSDVVFNLNSSEYLRFQLSDGTVRVPNTKSFLSQNLFTDIVKPLAFTNDISLQGQNSTNDGYEEYLKINSTTKKVDFSKAISSITCNEFNSDGNVEVVFKRNTDNFIQFKTDGRIHIPRQCFFYSTVGLDNAGSLSMVKRPESSFQIFEFSNTFNTLGKYRFKLGSTNILEMTTSLIQATRNLQCDAGIKTNTINTATDANLAIQRNNVEYLRLDTTDDNIVCSKEIVGGGGIKCNTHNSDGNSDIIFKRNDIEFFKLSSTANGIEVADTKFLYTPRVYTDLIACNKLDEDTVFYGSNTAENQAVEYFRFNHINERVDFSKQLRANGNILVKNLQINQFPVGVEYCDFRLENADSIMRFYVGNSTSVNLQITNDGLTLGRVASCTAGLKSNIIDTYTDTDLIFRRNGEEYMRLQDMTGTDILNIANDKGVSASYVFGNRFWNRSFSSDTTFFGSNVAGDDRVEYMKWNYLSQSLDFNAPIDNTGISIIGNIVDTTVSDERLKTNINDVESNFTECVKNVKVKTFEYTDEKYKNNDKYGFIAQELQKHLPKEFNHIVQENQEKHSDDKYLSINYMKVNLLLWGALQEEINKREHIESRLFELEDIVKEMRGKKTTKPKAKAKSKTKAEK